MFHKPGIVVDDNDDRTKSRIVGHGERPMSSTVTLPPDAEATMLGDLFVDNDHRPAGLPTPKGHKMHRKLTTPEDPGPVGHPMARGCEKQPCHNGAECRSATTNEVGFVCRCAFGFYGTLCEYGTERRH